MRAVTGAPLIHRCSLKNRRAEVLRFCDRSGGWEGPLCAMAAAAAAGVAQAGSAVLGSCSSRSEEESRSHGFFSGSRVRLARAPDCRRRRCGQGARASLGPLLDVGALAGDGSNLTFALAGGGAIAALAAALSIADPEKRRQKQAVEAGGDEKDVVRNYFNTQGFERWKRIYGETDDVNSVQLDIRQGHAQTVEKVLGLLKDGASLQGVSVCDAGCGTGSLAIPLALEGAAVSASDISSAMVTEAAKRAADALAPALKDGKVLTSPQFEARDLESLSGKYDIVTCLDVLIHYPQDKAGAMITHLASLADKRLVLSFAPKTLYYSVLKRIGELFPGPSKATRAYLHAEEDVEAALNAAGWVVKRRDMTATKFYFSRLLEAVPANSQ